MPVALIPIEQYTTYLKKVKETMGLGDEFNSYVTAIESAETDEKKCIQFSLALDYVLAFSKKEAEMKLYKSKTALGRELSELTNSVEKYEGYIVEQLGELNRFGNKAKTLDYLMSKAGQKSVKVGLYDKRGYLITDYKAIEWRAK